MEEKDKIQNQLYSLYNAGILGAGAYFTYQNVKDNENVQEAWQKVQNEIRNLTLTEKQRREQAKQAAESVPKNMTNMSENIMRNNVVADINKLSFLEEARDITAKTSLISKFKSIESNIFSPGSVLSQISSMRNIIELEPQQQINLVRNYYKYNADRLREILNTVELDENLNPNIKKFVKDYYNHLSEYSNKIYSELESVTDIKDLKRIIAGKGNEAKELLEELSFKVLNEVSNNEMYKPETIRRLNVLIGKSQSSSRDLIKNLLIKDAIRSGGLKTTSSKDILLATMEDLEQLAKDSMSVKVANKENIIRKLNNISKNIGVPFSITTNTDSENVVKLVFGSKEVSAKEVVVPLPNEKGIIQYNKSYYKELTPYKLTFENNIPSLQKTDVYDVLNTRLRNLYRELKQQNVPKSDIVARLAEETRKIFNQHRIYLGATPPTYQNLTPQKILQSNQIKIVNPNGEVIEAFKIGNSIESINTLFKGMSLSEIAGTLSLTPGALKSGNILDTEFSKQFGGLFTIDIQNNINAMKLYRDTRVLANIPKTAFSGMTLTKFQSQKSILNKLIPYRTLAINSKMRIKELGDKNINQIISELNEQISRSKDKSIKKIFKLVSLEQDQALMAESAAIPIGQEVTFENVDFEKTVIAKKGNKVFIPKGSTIFFESGHKQVAEGDIIIKDIQKIEKVTKDAKGLTVKNKVVGELVTDNIEKLFGQSAIKVMVSDKISDQQMKLLYALAKKDPEVLDAVSKVLSGENVEQSTASLLSILEKKSLEADIAVDISSIRTGERAKALLFDYVGQEMAKAGLQDEFIKAAEKAGLDITYNKETGSYIINKFNKSKELITDAYKETILSLYKKYPLDSVYEKIDESFKIITEKQKYLEHLKSKRKSMIDNLKQEQLYKKQEKESLVDLRREIAKAEKEYKLSGKKELEAKVKAAKDNYQYKLNEISSMNAGIKSKQAEINKIKNEIETLREEIKNISKELGPLMEARKYAKIFKPYINNIEEILETGKNADRLLSNTVFKNLYSPFVQSMLIGEKGSFNRDVFANLSLKSALLKSNPVYDAFIEMLSGETVLTQNEIKSLDYLYKWLNKDLKLPVGQMAEINADLNKIILGGKELNVSEEQVYKILKNLTNPNDSRSMVAAANELQNLLAKESELYKGGFNIVKIRNAGQLYEVPILGRTMNHFKSYLEEIISLEPEMAGAKDVISILSKGEKELYKYTSLALQSTLDVETQKKQMNEHLRILKAYMEDILRSDNNILKAAMTARPLSSAQLSAEFKAMSERTQKAAIEYLKTSLNIEGSVANELIKHKTIRVNPADFEKMIGKTLPKNASIADRMAVGLIQAYPSTGIGNTQTVLIMADKNIKEAKFAATNGRLLTSMFSDTDGDVLHAVSMGRLNDYSFKARQQIRDVLVFEDSMNNKFYKTLNEIISSGMQNKTFDKLKDVAEEAGVKKIATEMAQKQFEKSIVGPVTNLSNAFKSVMLLDKGGAALKNTVENQLMLMMLESVIKAKKNIGIESDATKFARSITDFNKYLNNLLQEGVKDNEAEIQAQIRKRFSNIFEELGLTNKEKEIKDTISDALNSVIKSKANINEREILEVRKMLESGKLFDSMADDLANRFVYAVKNDRQKLKDLIGAFSKKSDIKELYNTVETILMGEEIASKTGGVTASSREIINKPRVGSAIMDLIKTVYQEGGAPLKIATGALMLSGVLYGISKGTSADDYEMPIAAKSAVEIDPSLAPNMKTIHVGNPSFDVRLDSIINEVQTKEGVTKYINGLLGTDNVRITLYDRTQNDRYF